VLTISEVGRRVGLRPSAIRYYEQIGILPTPRRISGQRRYDEAGLYRLATLQRAREIGFTLEEIRRLFAGSSSAAQAAERWAEVSQAKLSALETLINELKPMQMVLRDQGKCGCASLEGCGKWLIENRNGAKAGVAAGR
jgi:MerR family transcriptional regulator, redox-sensitive transcriptional activator SoxR